MSRPVMECGGLVIEAYHEYVAAREAWLHIATDAQNYDDTRTRYHNAELLLAAHCALGISVALANAEDAA